VNTSLRKNEYRTVGELFSGIGVFLPNGVENLVVTGIEYNSKDVKPGNIFFAIRGSKVDGADFISEAVENGAAMVVSERFIPISVPLLECAPVRRILAEVSGKYYGNPSRELRVIGVTGTNGKTSVCGMVRSIFEIAGISTAQFGTLGHIIGDEFEETLNTTPESKEIQRLLRKALDYNCKAAVFEVSSHSLVQYRVHNVDFDIGVFTNLSSEHLDYHRDMEDYFRAKKRLFEYLRDAKKTAIINMGDAYGRMLAEMDGLDVIGYGDYEGSDIYIKESVLKADGTKLKISTPHGEMELRFRMAGRFNAENALAAVSVAVVSEIPFDKISEGLEQFNPPRGRMQRIDFGQPFKIYIDYAHTPDALRRLLKSVREFTEGRIIIVFGCGGDRDKSKRVPMAEVVSNLADLAILTSDNPRTEDPEKILDEVESGFRQGFEYSRLSDRKKAIKLALKSARKGDTVIIAGKGHENYQIYCTEKKYFSEVEIIGEFFKTESKI